MYTDNDDNRRQLYGLLVPETQFSKTEYCYLAQT